MSYHVLVTDGHVRSGLAAVRSLGRAGHSVTVGAPHRWSDASFSRHASESFVYTDPQTDRTAFRTALFTELDRRDIDVILPIGHYTTHAVNRDSDALSARSSLLVPGADAFERTWDKAATMTLASEVGVPYPETRVPTEETNIRRLADEIGYPAVVKPRSGSGSRGISYAESAAAVERAVERLVAETGSYPLVQERIPDGGEAVAAAFLFGGDGQRIAEFAYRRLREYPLSGGPSTLRESIAGETIREQGRRLLSHLGWTGPAMVEFKRDPRDGTAKLLEINPRFWGSLQLPISSGVDFPALAVTAAVGERVAPITNYEIGVRTRFLLPGDLLNLFARHDWAALREFRPLLSPNLDYDILDRSDPMPVVGRLFSMARFALKPSMWRRVVFR